MLFICYKKCTTCRDIEKQMLGKGWEFEKRDIKEENPTRDEIRKWHEDSGLDIGRFYNTSGKIYRDNNLKEKRKEMSLDDQYDLLASDGMLVKRPILIDGDDFYIGPDVRKFVEGK